MIKQKAKSRTVLLAVLTASFLNAGMAEATQKGKQYDTEHLKYTETERTFTARWAKGTKRLMFVHKDFIFNIKKTKELFLERETAEEVDIMGGSR